MRLLVRRIGALGDVIQTTPVDRGGGGEGAGQWLSNALKLSGQK